MSVSVSMGMNQKDQTWDEQRKAHSSSALSFNVIHLNNNQIFCPGWFIYMHCLSDFNSKLCFGPFKVIDVHKTHLKCMKLNKMCVTAEGYMTRTCLCHIEEILITRSEDSYLAWNIAGCMLCFVDEKNKNVMSQNCEGVLNTWNHLMWIRF